VKDKRLHSFQESGSEDEVNNYSKFSGILLLRLYNF